MLSGGAAAVETGGAVLLTNGSTQSGATAGYLAAHPGATRYALGGQAAAADPSAIAIVGTDRYDTSAKVADRFFATPASFAFASGLAFPDALAGGAHVASKGGPMMLVNAAAPIPSSGWVFLADHKDSIAKGWAYGGSSAVGTAVIGDAVTVIS